MRHCGQLRMISVRPGLQHSKIRKRLFPSFLLLIAFNLLLMAACFERVEAASKRPNILFLFADDHRADTIDAWGNSHIRTPNLDKLVASGFSFRGNYIFGGNNGAVCMPSRAMLMSGKNWFHIDVKTLAGVKLMPEL